MYQQQKQEQNNIIIYNKLMLEIESGRATKLQKPDEETHQAFLHLEIEEKIATTKNSGIWAAPNSCLHFVNICRH